MIGGADGRRGRRATAPQLGRSQLVSVTGRSRDRDVEACLPCLYNSDMAGLVLARSGAWLMLMFSARDFQRNVGRVNMRPGASRWRSFVTADAIWC